MEMKSAFEELLLIDKGKKRVINSSNGLNILYTEDKNLIDIVYQEFVKPIPKYSYRQVNYVNKKSVVSKLKNFRIEISHCIRKNVRNTYLKQYTRLTQDPLFNDLVFVMGSAEFIEFQNIKNKALEIDKISERQYEKKVRDYFITIQQNIMMLLNRLEQNEYQNI